MRTSLFLSLLAGCSYVQEDATFPVDGAFARVVLDAGAADITVLGTDRASGALVHDTSRWNGAPPDLGVAFVDGELHVAPRCPTRVGVGVICDAELTIEIPADVPVFGWTGSGDLRILDLDGAIDVETGSGDVQLDGTTGALTLGAGSGDVTLRDVRGDAIVTLDAGDLTARDLASARFDAESGSGDVTLAWSRVPESVRARTGSGDVALTVPAGAYDLGVDTISGDATVAGVRHDPAANAELRVASDAGDVTIVGF